MNFEINDALQKAVSKPVEWGESLVQMLPNLAAALLILLAFWLAARLSRRLVTGALERSTSNREVIGLLGTVAYILVLSIGAFMSLDVLQLKKTVTSLLAGIGIAGLALGFALQDLAANFVSGIMMSVRQPFKLDDVIETNGFMGKVVGISMRSTLVRTFSGQIVQIPNKQVFNNPVENYSRSGERRVELDVGVAYGDDLEKAQQVAIDAIGGMQERDTERDPEAYWKEFGGSSINMSVRFWIRYPEQNFVAARSEAVVRLKKAFDEAGLTIPFPIRTLDFGVVGGEKLAEALPERLFERASA